MKQVFALLRKEFLIEYRNMHTLMGTLLYIAVTVFAVYMMVGQPEAQIWNSLFWIAQLFVVVNAADKSFSHESPARLRYYRTLVAPWQYILARILYNLIYIALLSIVCLGLFILLLGNSIHDFVLYFSVAMLGTASLAVLFTFIAAIGHLSRQGTAMAAILGFPLAIPLVLVVSKLSVPAIMHIVQEGEGHLFWMLILLFVLMIVLALILYPFLWRE